MVIFKGKKELLLCILSWLRIYMTKVVTRKRTKKDITSKFPILIGLHQG